MTVRDCDCLFSEKRSQIHCTASNAAAGVSHTMEELFAVGFKQR